MKGWWNINYSFNRTSLACFLGSSLGISFIDPCPSCALLIVPLLGRFSPCSDRCLAGSAALVTHQRMLFGVWAPVGRGCASAASESVSDCQEALDRINSLLWTSIFNYVENLVAQTYGGHCTKRKKYILKSFNYIKIWKCSTWTFSNYILMIRRQKRLMFYKLILL